MYQIRSACAQDVPSMVSLILRVQSLLPDPSIFFVDEGLPHFIEEHYRTSYVAATSSGELAGLLIVVIPTPEENLGLDISLPPEDLPHVLHMDTCVVAPEHRGHHLEQRLLDHAEKHIDTSRFHILLCTVSPNNPASLHSVEKTGYRIASRTIKYGGLDRYILIRNLQKIDR